MQKRDSCKAYSASREREKKPIRLHLHIRKTARQQRQNSKRVPGMWKQGSISLGLRDFWRARGHRERKNCGPFQVHEMLLYVGRILTDLSEAKKGD
jgi:hypothetical protein